MEGTEVQHYSILTLLLDGDEWSIQFISHSTDPIQGHQEHMDMEIDKNKKQST